MTERKVWNEEEDQILKNLVEVRKVTKWSQIAKIFSTEFGIHHRNGKQCRERYLNHLASGLKKGDWTHEQEEKLIKLHNRYGNRWAEISRHFQGRTDNCVKNQLYSKLRKAMKFINDSIETRFRKKFKLLKVNFIYKLIQMADEKYKSTPAIKKQAFEESYCKQLPVIIELKNKILKLQCVQQGFEEQKVATLICQINKFNKTYKKRIPKKRSHRDLNSDSDEQLHNDSIMHQQQQGSDDDDDVVKAKPKQSQTMKKGFTDTKIQIKISAPVVGGEAIIEEQKQQLVQDQSLLKEQKKGFTLLQKDSLSSNSSKNIGRLHSLSIEKDPDFQSILSNLQVQPNNPSQNNPSSSLFNRIDPFVHGQQNQQTSKFFTKHSSSIQSIPNIMVDITSGGQLKPGNEMKTSRLRSFGSIENSFQSQQRMDKQSLSNNKEQVEYWLSNVQ